MDGIASCRGQPQQRQKQRGNGNHRPPIDASSHVTKMCSLFNWLQEQNELAPARRSVLTQMTSAKNKLSEYFIITEIAVIFVR